MNESAFEKIMLDDSTPFFRGRLPEELIPDDKHFDTLWALHPDEFHIIHMPGGPVPTPRWQQAYGADYHYTGRTNRALPVPASLQPLVDWCKANADERLNGVLLNWYDGKLDHYIGRHRDSTVDMVPGSAIVTISFGEGRIFRLRPWRAAGKQDFQTSNGTVFVMPFETNQRWTHEVPHMRRHRGRRISVTLRAFTSGVLSGQD